MRSFSGTSSFEKTIFAFLVIFAATLTNSIFVNQIGYYGALLLLLIKFGVSKENPFKRTELEFYFLFFLLAELLSAIFSVDPAHAFNNFLKRLLLIPVVYTITAIAINPRRVSKIFYVFVVFSIISSLLYLWNSYSYYLRGLFQLTGSGPFLFHYPITTSELFSFTALILFAFVIQKNLTAKKKLIYFLGFAVTFLSLLATFKRTGWIGFAAGVVVIIILKRKYIYLLPLVLTGLAIIFTQHSSSKIELLNTHGKFEKIGVIETGGQVNELRKIGAEIFVSDYTGGISKISNYDLRQLIDFDVPVISFDKWNRSYFTAELVDTRFKLIGRNSENDFVELEDFMSKGITKDYSIIENRFYALDIDSGLTIFPDPANLQKRFEYKDLRGFKKLVPFDGGIVLFSKSAGMKFIEIENGLADKTHELNIGSDRVQFADTAGGNLYVQSSDSIYLVSDKSFTGKAYYSNLPELTSVLPHKDNIYCTTLGGGFYRLTFSENSLNAVKLYSFGYNPNSVLFSGDTLYSAHLKRNRFASIFDPYLPANANRIALWRAGIKMFLDHPLFGVGDIDLAKLYKIYKRPSDKEIQGHLHNNYFHFLAILGLFGFIAVALLLFKLFVLLVKTVKKYPAETFENTLALGFAGVFVSFLFAGLTEWNFGDHEIITFIWFTVGMALSLKKIIVKN